MVRSPPISCSCGGLIELSICSRCGPKPKRVRGPRSKREHRKLYQSRRWRTASKVFRQENPFCRECEKHGKLTPSALVDHIEPHKGDVRKFWDTENWQPLCWRCHGIKSQQE